MAAAESKAPATLSRIQQNNFPLSNQHGNM